MCTLLRREGLQERADGHGAAFKPYSIDKANLKPVQDLAISCNRKRYLKSEELRKRALGGFVEQQDD